MRAFRLAALLAVAAALVGAVAVALAAESEPLRDLVPALGGAGRWAEIAATATGDRGARAYLTAHEDAITLVECSDVAEAYDIDTPDDLRRLK